MAQPAEDAALTSVAPGLRTLKKLRTRTAIQDSALELFAEVGFDETTVEQIAARTEVSTATFFRYFGTKVEVIISGLGYPLPELEQAIVGRPSSENDLTIDDGFELLVDLCQKRCGAEDQKNVTPRKRARR